MPIFAKPLIPLRRFNTSILFLSTIFPAATNSSPVISACFAGSPAYPNNQRTFSRQCNNNNNWSEPSSHSYSSSTVSLSSSMPNNLDWDSDITTRQEALSKCILPLSSTSHKGSSGRIGILGGSAKYTGAPYYAAMASLKVGADLAFVFCAQEAALPIKCYSPELMVSPVYAANDFDRFVAESTQDSPEAIQAIHFMVQEVTSMMNRMHVLVIGPGLGRCPLVFRATAQIIKEAMARDLPLIIDADGLFFLTLDQYRDILSSTSSCKVILTPNAMEQKRLSSISFPENVIVVQKGFHDKIVINNDQTVYTCLEVGGLKRSGGIGDVLAGTLGTLMAWNIVLDKQSKKDEAMLAENSDRSNTPLACWTACCITKRATKTAFDKHQRAMTAPDVLNEIGPTVTKMTSRM